MSVFFLYRLGGLALILAGVAYILDTVLDFTYPDNLFGVGMFVSLFGLYGMTAIFFYQNERAKLIGLLAYILNFTGLSGLVAVAFFNNLLKPKLTPEVIRELLSGEALGFFIAVGVIFLAGALLMCAAIWIGNRLPKYSAIIYAAGAVPVALPPLFPKLATDVGGLAISVALIIWGLTLIRSREV